jgi:hypothetical protein
VKRAALIAALGLAGQAGAEVYMPECSDPGVGVYDVAWHQGGFVFYASGLYDAGETLLILEDCSAQQRLTMRIVDTDIVDKPKGGALFDVVEKAVQSKQRYTMGQIAGIARETGAKVNQRKASDVSCACKTYGGQG